MGGEAADIQAGMPAPAFSAQDQHGKTISLSQFQGKANVVLYFYPKDDTPGCTKQACSLRDGHGALLAAGAVVLGVSADDVKSHKAFADKFNLNFSILADPDKKIVDAYGVRMPVLGIARRVTFIIDRKGIVRRVLTEVDTAGHDRQVLAILKELS
ncbi:MAG: peroxiredoxin [Acidobacteria bacterium]|nr:peroxiredoxin [Acidobacteriota bacterium]